MNRITFGVKYASATKTYTFDFTSDLAIGETISSAVLGSAIYSGNSGATVTLGSETVSGARVSVPISGGTEGAIFLIDCMAITSLGQVLMQTAYLPIIPEGA